MKKTLSILFILLSIVLFTFTACEQKTKKEQVREEIREAGNAVSEAWQEEKSGLEIKLKKAQSDLGIRIDRLNNELKEATDETRADIQNQLDQLKMERRKASTQLKRFGDIVDKGWNDFKREIEMTLKGIDDSINK